MKYGFPTMTCTARRIERTAGVGRFRGKTDKGEISTAPSHAILAHPGKPISPETSVEDVGCQIFAIMPQSDLLSPKTPNMIPTRVEFLTAALGCVRMRRRTRATVENSCTAVQHLTKALFLSKPVRPLLTGIPPRACANPCLTSTETCFAPSIVYAAWILQVALHSRRGAQTMSFWVPPGLGSRASAA